jgi:hypothetical protein
MDADPAEERGRQHGLGKQPTHAPGPVHRSNGNSTSGKGVAKQGRPALDGGQTSTSSLGAMVRAGVGQGHSTVEPG